MFKLLHAIAAAPLAIQNKATSQIILNKEQDRLKIITFCACYDTSVIAEISGTTYG